MKQDIQALMQDVLRALETRESRSCERSAPLGFEEEQRRKELAHLMTSLPELPPNWRVLVHARIAAAISRWSWGHGNLVLLGDTGCGKTLGATALAKRLLTGATSDGEWRRARRILFVDAAQLAIAREQHGLGEGEAPLVQRSVRAPLLFLDELGYLDKETGVIEQVIDARNKARLPLVVTSGMQPNELQNRYGSSTARKMMAPQTSDVLVQAFSS